MALALMLSGVTPTAADAGIDKETLRQRYAPLYGLAPRPLADGSIAFGAARLFHRQGIRVLYLKGDHFEMSYQHGRLLNADIHRGALPVQAHKIPAMIAGVFGEGSWLATGASWLIDQLVHGPLLARVPDAYQEEMFAMSEAAGLAHDDVVRAFLANEAAFILAKYYIEQPWELASEIADPSQCTSFSAWGSRTAGGEMLIGRNLDYPLNGTFDRFPTVIYAEPTDGDQRFMAVTSAGLHTAGITALNESGLFVAIHTVPSGDVSTRNTPVMVTASEVVRQARTFDEAVRIFERSPSPAGWAYHVVSTGERRAGTVETVGTQVRVVEARDELHVQSNHFATPELRASMLYVNKSVEEDTVSRSERARALWAEPRDLAGAMSVLADAFDPVSGRVRGIGNTVAVHTTVGSVVVQPDQHRLYVASDMAPAPHGRYVGLPTIDDFDVDDFATTSTFPEVDNGAFPRRHPTKAAALARFIEAKSAYEFAGDVRQALTLMQDVLTLDEGEPAYRFITGILAYKAGDPALAKELLGDVLELDHTPQLHLVARYYRGRILAHEGRADEALQDLKIVAASAAADHKLRQAAANAVGTVEFWGYFTLSPGAIGLMMQQADTDRYP